MVGLVDLVFQHVPLGAGSILRWTIFGAATHKMTGTEIWMDDVTGDGLGDLLIGRQNYSPAPDRIGVGALSLVVGAPALRELAASLQPLDLQSPPANLTIVIFVGVQAFGRLGIWMRTGDVTGDVTTDIDGNVIPADASSLPNRRIITIWVPRVRLPTSMAMVSAKSSRPRRSPATVPHCWQTVLPMKARRIASEVRPMMPCTLPGTTTLRMPRPGSPELALE